MRKIALILMIALVLIGAGYVLSRGGSPDVGTRDEQARELYLAGDEHLYCYQYGAAREKLAAAVQRDPDFALAVAALAVVHARLGQTALADSLAASADSLARRIDDPEPRLRVQLKLAAQGLGGCAGRTDSLLTLLEERGSKNLDVLVARAARAKARGDMDAVEALWREVIKHNPNHANAYNELGYMAYYRGDYAEAVELLQRYAYLAPDLANPHDSLGEILMYLGRYEEAEQEFRKALAKQPDFLASIFNLAHVYIARGELKKGTNLLEKLRGMTAGTSIERKVDELAIYTYYSNHLWKDLEGTTARYIMRYPDTLNAVFYRAMRLTSQDRDAEATAVMDSALAVWRESKHYAEDDAAWRGIDGVEAQLRALLCENSGDVAGAEQHWARALKAMSGYKAHDLRVVRECSAHGLLENGKPHLALAEVATVLAANPRQLRALTLAAEASLALDRRVQARQFVELLERSLAVADADFPLRERLAALQRELTVERPSS